MFRGLDQRKQAFYNNVARMVSRINSKLSTMKTEIYKTKSPERFQALLHKVLINYPLLKNIVKKTDFMKNIPLGTVIAYEILTKNIRNDGFRRKLRQAMGNQKLKDITTKTFIRINTLKASEADLEGFCLKKTCIPNVYELIEDPDATTIDNPADIESYDEEQDVESVQVNEEISSVSESDEEVSLEEENAVNDTVTEEKKVYKKAKDLYTQKLVPEKIKVQNFSSCLPAFILNPEKNSTIIDGTASPGNKTTHLCSIVENTGKIFAFERNEERFKTLCDQVEKYGATNVEAIHCDFLKVKPEEYKADYILLDPSCSGSGIHINYKKDKKRIDTLHNFQAMMLNHAFKFNPKKIVYSVCSVHPEEGEDVVKEALEKNPEYELEEIPNYTNQRGIDGYEFKDKVIRTNTGEEGAIGFFVALFRRKSNNDQKNE